MRVAIIGTAGANNDAGTIHTWKKSIAEKKIHIPLKKLNDRLNNNNDPSEENHEMRN